MYNKFILILFTFVVSITCNANWNPGKISVRSAKVTKFEVFDRISVIGQCKNDQSITYYANVSGTVEMVPDLQQGNKVKENDLIIAIDKALAEAIYSNARVTLKSAESAYLRDKSLFEKKHLSKESLEKSELNLEKSKHEFAKAAKMYADMLIRAPFDGEIGVIKVKIGDKIKEGDYLFSIISGELKNVFIQVPESLHGKIGIDTEVLIKDSKGNKATAYVDSVSGHISDHGTIDIKLKLKDKNDLIHGSYVNAELTLNKHLGLVIPEQSILKNDKGNFLYKIDSNNTIKLVYVNLGSRVDKSIEIISGDLAEGDNIVTEGLTKVYEGAVVEILE